MARPHHRGRGRRSRQQAPSGAAATSSIVDPSAADSGAIPPGLFIPSTPGAEAWMIGGGGGFSGVDFTTDRGYVYWPQLDTRREITSFTRVEMLRRSRAMVANVGFAAHIINGLAELVGFLTPLAISDDEEWNDLSNLSIRTTQEIPEVFDASGKVGLSEYQIILNKSAFRDADILPVKTESATGRARIATYEAHQIVNPPGQPDDPSQWRDGVLLNRFNKHLAYYLRDPSDPESGQIINAANAIYYGHWEVMGHNRPLPILSRALNHLQDIAEIGRDIKSGIKVRNLMPLSLERELGSQTYTEETQKALVGQIMKGQKGGPGAPGGAPGDKNLDYEKIMTGGTVPRLGPGEKLKALIDSAPHPNQFNALAFFIRDVCWGCGMPPEILWDISSLRGANNRLLNSKMQRWIGGKLITLRKWLQQYWSYAIAKEIKAGRLRPCRDPNWWNKIAFLPQESITADRAKEGKLDIDLVSNRLLSLQSYFGKYGMWWLDEIKQIARERRECKALGLAVADIERANVRDPGADNEEDDPEEDGGQGVETGP